MSMLTIWWMFHRPGRSTTSSRTSLLAIIAFAAATAIFLTVLGGVHGFIWRASADHTLSCLFDSGACASGTWEPYSKLLADDTATQLASSYVLFAAFACMLLIVPFAALAGSAARLAASRRDTRLAALRLAGATTGQVVALTALDAAGQALAGALIGVVGYVAAMPLIMLLNFQNQRFTFEQLWVGPLALVVVVAAVTVLALVSSLVTLRRVAITPLGVTARAAEPLPTVWRLIITAVVLLAAYLVFSNPTVLARFGDAVVFGVIFGFFFVAFAVVNLVGTWVVSARARAKARHPKDAATMIAMRRILDDPKRAWRNVSGIALAVFIAGVTSICGYLASVVNGPDVDPNDPAVVMLRDIGTGGLLTLVFAAVLAAVSCGVMQAGSVYEQAAEYRMLVLEGTDVATLNRARFIEVLTPLCAVVLVSAGCSLVLMFPLFAAMMTEPVTMLSYLGGIALCFVLVPLGSAASNRVAASLNLTGYRADD